MKKLMPIILVAIVGILGLGLMFIKPTTTTHHQVKPQNTTKTATSSNSDNSDNQDNQDNIKLQPLVPWEKTGKRIDIQPVHPGNVIYYKLTDTPNDPYAQLWQKAITQWNNLGVIKFQQVANDYKGYCVVLGGNYNPAKGARDYQAASGAFKIADTTFQTQYFPDSNIAHFCTTKATLTDMVSSMPKDKQLFAAEHELGHVLGFDHDGFKYDGMYAVMNWEIHDTQHTKPLGGYEKMALQAIYK